MHRSRKSINDLKLKAKELGGECRSSKYKSMHERYIWHCNKCKNTWKAVAINVYYKNKWCRLCASKEKGRNKRKWNIKDINQLLKSRGIKCLSEEYISLSTNLIWNCLNCSNTWATSPAHILNDKTGCPHCSGKAPWTLKKVKHIANERGWTLLSKKISRSLPLQFKCADNHKFSKHLYQLRRGEKCPICGGYAGEEYCRAAFETLFASPFPKCRPTWLRSTTGHRMELDGYNESLKLAFEHQGYQHIAPGWRQSPDRFIELKKRDKRKALICRKRGIKLIVVPDLFANGGAQGLIKKIWSLCINEGKTPVVHYNSAVLNLRKVHTSVAKNYMTNLSEAAKRNGGKLTSKLYQGSDVKYRFKCKNNHIFFSEGHRAMSRLRCPHCAGNAKITQIHVNKRVHKHGICLTKVIKNSLAFLQFKCRVAGHIFEDIYEKVMNRIRLKSYFCPLCKAEGKSNAWHDKLWQKNYRKLKRFSDNYGHIRVPISYDRSLYHWAKRLRTELKKNSSTSRLLIGDRKILIMKLGIQNK